MKKLFTSFIIFFFILDINANDPDYDKSVKISFSISCKAMDVILIGIEDGVSKRYSSINGVWDEYFSIGEMFNINIDFTDRDRKSNGHILHFNMPTLGIRETFDDIGIMNMDIQNVRFNENGISFNKGNKYFTEYELDMKRYYKNDWQFILDGQWGGARYIVTANCMGMPGTYKEFLEGIKGKNLNNGIRGNK